MKSDKALNDGAEQPWYRKFGFYNNPFTIKPAYFDYELVGYNNIINELAYKITSGSMVFIEGPLGSGKTSILQHVTHTFKEEKKIIFLSCNQINEGTDIASLLKTKFWVFEKLFGIKPKNIVLLLDEIQELDKKNLERVKYLFDHDYAKSVVFTGIDYNNVAFPLSVKERIGNNIVKVPVLSSDDAVKLIRNRIGNCALLSDDIIKELYTLSNFNPRRLLHRCDEVCNHVINDGRDMVTKDDIKNYLNNK